MQYLAFEVENFKGIVHLRFDFNPRQRHNVYTIVGLNESGKTTILESFNFTSYKTENLDPLNLPGYSVKDVRDLIPISKRSNFNDKISIRASYRLEAHEQKSIKDFLSKECGYRLTEDIKDFTIIHTYEFHSSNLTVPRPPITWNISFAGRYKGSRRNQKIKDEDWQKAVKHIRNLFPTVLYFPNFLFEIPDKIYLEDPPTDVKKHEFYQMVLQDVLNAIGDDTNLNEHITKRAKEGDSYQKQAMESVLLNMGSHIGKTVFQQWDRIFNRQSGNREIDVRLGQDEPGKLYLQLRLKEGGEIYTISERSLGFRWFFAFLLSTHYRRHRKDAPENVLFLLDEPASNLHSSAQVQLLESFKDLQEKFSIIYTTHSHHMINPDWLENTFVSKNEGLEYNLRDDSYSSNRTLITLNKYRTFAAQYPDQSTYFQPVLDVLDYRPSKLENIPNVVMIEGKNDFYILKYFHEKISHESRPLNFMPGNGAGSLDNLIQMYIAWGREFIVILDSDKAGTDEKKRYESIYGILVEGRIFGLADIDASWSGKGIEFLIGEQERLLIQTTIYSDTKKYKKRQFNRAIQELYASGQAVALSLETKMSFEKITEFCISKLNIN